MSAIKKPRHVVELIARIDALAETMELDEENAERLRAFVTAETGAEYLAGSRSGMAWVRENESHGANHR